jgi:hypothetical protein
MEYWMETKLENGYAKSCSTVSPRENCGKKSAGRATKSRRAVTINIGRRTYTGHMRERGFS